MTSRRKRRKRSSRKRKGAGRITGGRREREKRGGTQTEREIVNIGDTI